MIRKLKASIMLGWLRVDREKEASLSLKSLILTIIREATRVHKCVVKGIVFGMLKYVFKIFYFQILKPCKPYNIDQEGFWDTLNIMRKSRIKMQANAIAAAMCGPAVDALAASPHLLFVDSRLLCHKTLVLNTLELYFSSFLNPLIFSHFCINPNQFF